MTTIPVNLAVEDALSEAVLRVILNQTGKNYLIENIYTNRGFGYLKAKSPAFNQAARIKPFILLTDLDTLECPPTLRAAWIKGTLHPNFLLRVAVREVESWIIAHRKAFAGFLGIPTATIPLHPDDLNDPKAELLRLVNKSRRRELKEDILPAPGSSSPIGPGYNSRLGAFVWKAWQVEDAMKYSPSLARTFRRFENFSPIDINQGMH